MLIIQAQHAFEPSHLRKRARNQHIGGGGIGVMDLQGALAPSASPVQTRSKGGETARAAIGNSGSPAAAALMAIKRRRFIGKRVVMSHHLQERRSRAACPGS